MRRPSYKSRYAAVLAAFKKYNLSQTQISSVLAIPNIQKRLARLDVLRAHRVPLTGIVYKLGMRQSMFDAIIQRAQSRHNFSKSQQEVFNFLVKERKWPEDVAVKVASIKNAGQLRLEEKIAFFESFKLDPKRYGVPRIPILFYVPLLKDPLSNIKKGIQKQVLWKLEDRHAAQQLDAEFPYWRSLKSFFREGRRVRPAKVLRELRFRVSRNEEPRVDVLMEPSKAAKVGSRLKGKSRVVKGTRFDPRERRKLRAEILALEAEINKINTTGVGLEHRHALVQKRNSLLIKL